jgi:four helix bundle protein
MSSKVRSFEDLIVWQKTHKLTLRIFGITKTFPPSETYSIISQLRRASYSVPSNIVEGHSRNSIKEFKHFLAISKGSLS